MFHGYRGSSERDLCGGVQRCFKLGRSALLVDQRAHGRSDGHIISFGVNERKDCLAWVDFMVKHFGPDVKIILTGISMGASTQRVKDLSAQGKFNVQILHREDDIIIRIVNGNPLLT